MTKVCHISTVHSTYDTRIFLKECCSLASNGYAVTLVIPGSKDEYINGVHIKAIKKYDKVFFRITLTALTAFIKAFKTKSKIYHFHDPELFFVGVIFKILGKKVIFDVHENISAQIKRKNWLPFKNVISYLYRGIDFLSCKFFFLIFAENSYVEVYQKFKPNYEIILNYPDLSNLDRYIVSNRSSLGNEFFYVGGVSFDRGIDSIIESLAILKLKVKNFIFHCIGPIDAGVMEGINRLESFKHVRDNIIFYGPLKFSESYEISKSCKLGLSILKPIENYKKSYSTKFFEYMSVQLPVITSDFELYESVIKKRNCGVCVDPLNTKEIASCIYKLINDDAIAKQMGENGRRAVIEKYNWSIEEAKLVQIYRQLL